MRFANTPEDQALGSMMLSAMAEGMSDRRAGIPLFERDGVSIYRILLFGLKWTRKSPGVYEANDGTERTYRVMRDDDPTAWTGALFTYQGGDGTLHHFKEWVGYYRTMREAKNACADHARRLPWIEGAPW